MEISMEHKFTLNENQLLDISEELIARVRQGLERDNQQIKSLLTYVPMKKHVAGDRAIVIDLGGTNVRSALMSMGNAPNYILKGTLEDRLPLTRGVPIDRETYLRVQSKLIADLDAEDGLPLGYCFSFPAKATVEGDAVLLKWTKGIFVPDTIGEPAGKLLFDDVTKQGVRCSHVSVINDTVASLFAGLTKESVDAYIGLIVGTGTNMASFIDSANIQKISPELNWQGDIPVNFESGNFHPPHLNEFDDIVDVESENPGEQRFEKAVSGAYLGRILKAAHPDSDFDPSSGSRGVVALAYDHDDNNELTRTARAILKRSAQLVAASLSGLIRLLSETRSVETVRIVAEGSLIWKAPRFSEETESTLYRMLRSLDLPHIKVELMRIENANLIGSAMAALAK